MTDSPALNPELALAIGYARPKDRPALTALFALDATCARILRSTSEPLIGQMRLTWWHDALERLDEDPAPAEPVLQALQADVLSRRIAGGTLALAVEGWEALLEEPLKLEAVRAHGRDRGSLFVVAGQAIGVEGAPLAGAGEGWALVDVARNLRDRDLAQQVIAAAQLLLDRACGGHWPRALRPLGALAHRARLDLAVPLDMAIPIGAPRRVARMFWHRISGN